MIYQNPQLLYALSAIAIPIIIHLFSLRRHKIVYFSSIRFLKEIKDETKRKSRLRNILILISRILAIIFLVIGFAKPYIPSGNSDKSRQVFIYIDNSQSMDTDFGKGNLLNIAKKRAIEITEAYSSEKEFYLVTNDFESKNTSKYNTDEIRSQIENVKTSTIQRSIYNIISRANSINTTNKHLYFISDFQKNTVQIEGIKESDINNRISLIQIRKIKTTNINIDTLFTSPILISDNEIEIKSIISNRSDKEIKDEVLFLHLNKKQKSQQYINLKANETKEIKFQFSVDQSRYINGEIRTQDTPVTFDNSLFFTLNRVNKINLTIINQEYENIAFNALFRDDTSLFNLSSVKTDNINYNILSKQDFIILNEVTTIERGLRDILLSFVNNGGSLLLVPAEDLNNFNKYNILLESLKVNTISNKKPNKLKINQFSTKHSIYKNVFAEKLDKVNYPLSHQYYLLNKKRISTQIIGFANKKDFLSEYTIGKGTIYQFSSPLRKRYNNFTKHALFVPTLLNMASSSVGENTPYHIIGSNKRINIKHIPYSNSILSLKGEGIEVIPTVSNQSGKHLIDYHNQITKNGIYSVMINNNIIDKIAFNYNTSEGITTSLTYEEIKSLISENNIQNTSIISEKKLGIKEAIKEQETGKEYWKISIILSLLFFALEILLIKLIKI